MRVKATREGLIGHITSSGYVIDEHVPFVALPSTQAVAMRLCVKVTNPLNGRSIKAIVLDAGPWNVNDHAYVFDGARPQAESGTDLYGRHTNGAGIDLGEFVWKFLGMADNGLVDWEAV